jgi:YD repeat-containing protein
MTIDPASGVVGTGEQSWEYDGLSRPTSIYDQDALAAGLGDGTTVFEYDSLGRSKGETTRQTVDGSPSDRVVAHSSFDVDVPKAISLPNGRALSMTYDVLHRLSSVRDAVGRDPDIASWRFAGPERILDARLANGVSCRHGDEAGSRSAIQGGTAAAWDDACADRLGYDGAGRAVGKRYLTRCTAGAPLYTIHQTTAQNAAAGWDFLRASPADTIPGDQGLPQSYRYSVRQLTTQTVPGWERVRVHPPSVPLHGPARHAVEQVTASGTAAFKFVDLHGTP